MLICAILYGASPKNYYWFGFYDMDHSHRKTFVTHMMSEKIQKRCNDPAKTRLFQNKGLFYETFEKYMGRRCLTTDQMSGPEKLTDLGAKIIYKPITGSQGFGIKVFDLNDEEPEQVFETLIGLPAGVIESFLTQHKLMGEMSDAAVNIVRIVTGVVGQEVFVLGATVAFARKLPYTNASGDAIFAIVDIRNGEIVSDGCDYEERIYQTHPVSGRRLMGFHIPFWNQILDLVRAAAMEVPEVRYVGWDIAITENGPVIIEGNDDPGYEWMQIYLINPSKTGKKGMYSVLLAKD